MYVRVLKGVTCFCAGGEARNELLCLVADPTFKENLTSTVEDLLAMNVVPVFNENDAISKGVVKATVSHPAAFILQPAVMLCCAVTSCHAVLCCDQMLCCAVL